MSKKIYAILILSLLANAVGPALAGDGVWEYQVVIVQGVTAGGAIKKQASGIYVDTKRTEILNQLAAEGWEVVAVTGAPTTDQSVYLRRERGR